jgi:hypothetical protein
MNPTPTALQTGTVEGGGMESPKAVAQIAALMQGTPIENIKAATELVNRAGVGKSAETTRGVRTPTSRVSHTGMPQDVIPGAEGSMPQSNMPIPGIIPEGQQALLDATNPSLMSTIMQEMEKRKPEQLPVKPKEPVPELSFLDKLKAVISTINRVAPYNWTAEGVKAGVDAAPEITKNAMEAVGTSGVQIPQGMISGLMSQPAQVFGGGTAAALAAGGLLGGSQNAQMKALELEGEVNDWTKARQQDVGINPENIQPAQQAGQWIGENVGPGILRTAKNLAFNYLASKTIMPGAEYMAEHYPIPNINPIQPAQAATAFGKPPLIVQTPGGPAVAHDATVQSLAWGGVFTLGVGAAPNAISRTIRIVKEMKPFGWTGMSDIFA